MQRQDALLLTRLHRHEPHVRPAHRLADRRSVGGVGLIALDVGLSRIAAGSGARCGRAGPQFARPVVSAGHVSMLTRHARLLGDVPAGVELWRGDVA